MPREQAATRISAYVYGNIITFATLVPLTGDDLTHGHAALLVLGVAASTYAAHVFADRVGHHVRGPEPVPGGLAHGLRDALPILSSAIVPALLLLAGGAGWITARAAVTASEIYLLVRMSLVGLLVERLHPTERAPGWTLVSGVLLAAAAAVVSLIKVALGH
ncbi:hypothetical protein [Actinoplanes sp. NBRC 101535]|uniref:hypothetical protein n=1 Tax=Actinoplanes sp. NBRC 101535 TaxID=3032196 RepID=UPI0024A45839|nr:hypothetical protein [Actinoplanes sp. NBRC 101535]GLY07776.1 hypothetical protein Acsp01_81550 [Actinoplanes sp. NBRC 101535]